MLSTEKVWESKTTIRFPDCDPFNHLNNSRYIDYFINAREDQLLGYYQFSPYEEARKKGISWVVSQNQIVYLRPVTLMETVIVQSTILHLGERDLLVEMRMWNLEKTVLKALLWTRFVHFNLTSQRSEAHSAELMAKFKPVENPLPEPVSFEKRVEQLKGKTAEQL